MSPVPCITDIARALVRRAGCRSMVPRRTSVAPLAVRAMDCWPSSAAPRSCAPAGAADTSATASSRQAAICTAGQLHWRIGPQMHVDLGRDRHLARRTSRTHRASPGGPAWKRPRSRGRYDDAQRIAPPFDAKIPVTTRRSPSRRPSGRLPSSMASVGYFLGKCRRR